MTSTTVQLSGRNAPDVAMNAVTSLQQQVRDCQRQLRHLRSSNGVAGGGEQEAGKVQKPHTSCLVDALEARLRRQQIQLNELIQRRPLDIQLIEALYREQRLIAEDLQTETQSHQNGHMSLPKPRSRLHSSDKQVLGTEADATATQHHRHSSTKNTPIAGRNGQSTLPSRENCSNSSSMELVTALSDIHSWLNETLEQIRHQQTLGGDLVSLQLQYEQLQAIWRLINEKQDIIESTLDTSRVILHDDRLESIQIDPRDDGSDICASSGSGGADSQQSMEKMYRQTYHVTKKWAEVRVKIVEWERMLDNMVEKMRIFQDTLEDVFLHLMELEESAQWPPIKDVSVKHLQPEFSRTQEFHRHVMAFKASVDHCNNMANHFQNSGIILSHRNVNRLEDLNSRWRNLVALTEERLNGVKDAMGENRCGLQPVISAYLDHCWERAVTTNNVPYYINHEKEMTQWDHPHMASIMQQLAELNCVRFSAYRTAMKLRFLQKRLGLDYLSLERVVKLFSGRIGQLAVDSPLNVNDVINYLSALFDRPVSAADSASGVVSTAMDLILNWLLNVYDHARNGFIQVLSFKVAVILMCKASAEEKYKQLFVMVSDSRNMINPQRLSLLLQQCVQIPRQLGESLSFGGTNVEPSVKSCFEKGNNGHEIEMEQFMEWMRLEPQSLVWIPVMHRLVAAETAKHQVKCSVCKQFPIVGFRYRCLKCFNFDMCQGCFFSGRKSKSHKLTHPMQEYSTATTSGEDVRDFTKTLKNKFRSKQYFQKHPRLGYLPVESMDDFADSPPPSSPHHQYSMQTVDMHSRLESYANKLAEVEQQQRASSMTDSGSEDEHSLIAHYCHSLHGNNQSHVLRSPMQIVMAMDVDQRGELQRMILDLEEENKVLQAEYDELRQAHNGYYSSYSNAMSVAAADGEYGANELDAESSREAEMIVEARLLRQHKGRLETRMRILEEHNQQLESQLHRLRQLVESPTADTRIVTFMPSLLSDGSPAQSFVQQQPTLANYSSSAVYSNGHQDFIGAGKDDQSSDVDDITEMMKNVSQLYSNKDPAGSQNVDSLLYVAGEVGKAVGTLVNIMTDDEDSDTETRQARRKRL